MNNECKQLMKHVYFVGVDSDKQRWRGERHEIFGYAGQADYPNDGCERDEPLLGTFLSRSLTSTDLSKLI